MRRGRGRWGRGRRGRGRRGRRLAAAAAAVVVVVVAVVVAAAAAGISRRHYPLVATLWFRLSRPLVNDNEFSLVNEPLFF